MTPQGAGPAVMTPMAWRIFALCFLVAMIDGFDTLLVSFIAPLLADEWRLAPQAVGRIFGAGLLGGLIGGLTVGPAADRFGRKAMLILSIAVFTVFTFACALARSPDELLLYRLLGGLGLGGALPIIIALTAENAPAARRSALVTWMFIGFPLGAVSGGAVIAAMVGDWGWRGAFWLGAVLPVLAAPAVLWGIPGRRHEAVTGTAAPRAVAAATAHLGEGRGPAAASLFLGVFALMLVSYFLINWTPTVLSDAGLPIEQAVMGGVVLNLGGVAGAIALTFATSRFAPFVPVGLAVAAGGLLVWLWGGGVSGPAALVLIFLTGALVIGGQLNVPAMAADLFPARVRGAGVGWTLGLGRIGSIIGPTIGGLLVAQELGGRAFFTIVAVPVAAAAAFVLLAGRLKPGPGAMDPGP